jgi:hypothetical protein
MFYLEHCVLEVLFPHASGTNHGKAGLHEENHTPRENHQPLVQVRLTGHIFRLKGLKVLTDADQRVRIYLAAISDGAGLVQRLVRLRHRVFAGCCTTERFGECALLLLAILWGVILLKWQTSICDYLQALLVSFLPRLTPDILSSFDKSFWNLWINGVPQIPRKLTN